MECSNTGEFIDLLLNSGADPNEKDDTGRTPLHYATRSGHCDTIIKLLLGSVDKKYEKREKDGSLA